MTTDEFQVWRGDFFGRHAKRCESIVNAANKLELKGRDAFATWYDVLKDTDLVDAMTASAWYQDHPMEWPPQYDATAGAIRDRAAKIKNQRMLDEYSGDVVTHEDHVPTFCEFCQNGGSVILFCRFADGVTNDGKRRWTKPGKHSWACRCPAGATKLKTLRHGKLVDFLPPCPDSVWQQVCEDNQRIANTPDGWDWRPQIKTPATQGETGVGGVR